MPDQARNWRVILSILLIVLIVATTFGMVWHHHGHRASTQCDLCQLVIQQPNQAAGACQTVEARVESIPHSIRLISRLVARQIPSRAPPA